MASRQDPQFKLRVPADLIKRIEDAAHANRRSVTKEIEARLVASFDGTQSLAPAFAELLEQHIQSEVKARLQQIAAKLGAEGGA